MLLIEKLIADGSQFLLYDGKLTLIIMIKFLVIIQKIIIFFKYKF